MKFKLNAMLSAMLFVSTGAMAQEAPKVVPNYDGPSSSLVQSVERLKGVMSAISTGDQSQLSEKERSAIDTAQKSSAAVQQKQLDPATEAQFKLQAVTMDQLAREVFVNALPPRDRALGRSVLLGDNTLPGTGKLYYFVSRSMPLNILKAYALDALYTGGTLVVRGIRKGDTMKEYIEEVVSEFNKADGNVLAGMEINPNLYDLFGVTVVPTVVWTNRAGLDDIGSGCQAPVYREDAPLPPPMELEGPDGNPIFVEKPLCAPLPESSYYKIAGVLNTNYILDRFESAGADAESIAKLRADLARSAHKVEPISESPNAMVPIDYELALGDMPRHILLDWANDLATMKVKRTGWGPAFSTQGDDDAEYRQELQQLIANGLRRP